VRTRRIAAGALEPMAQAIADAKKMFGLAAAARVISCYEAGRDGFWLHRYLTGRGDTNYVVDSASIEVDRRARRTKTDAVDLRGLLALLARYVAGHRRCWRVLRVPSVADEDARQLHRTWETLQGDRTRVINGLKAVLGQLYRCRFYKALFRTRSSPRCSTVIHRTVPSGTPSILARGEARFRVRPSLLCPVTTLVAAACPQV
jgi:transposase